MRWWLYQIRQQFFEGRSRWSLWLPVFFACGIGIYFALPFEPSKWVTLGLIEGLILLAVWWRFHPERLYFLVVPAMMLLGFADIQVQTLYLSSAQAPVPPQKLYLRGRIDKMDYNSRGNPRLILSGLHDYDGEKIGGRFRISLRPQQPELHSGQCVELVAKLFPLAKAALPGGYQFDRKSFYLGLSGSGYAESRVLPTDCAEPAGIGAKMSYAVAALRRSVIEHIKTVLPPDTAAVTAAIVAGEQGGIPQRIINSYRDSGLAHFLSISGLHMSMIAGLMFFFIRLLIALIPPLALRWDSKKISAVFALIISAVYLLISGAAVPAQRAFIMTFIVLLGVLADRRAISMTTIAWAAFIVLLLSPQALIGASFQMSFAAVIALIAFYEKLAAPLRHFLNGSGERRRSVLSRIWRILLAYVAGILISDLVASLATLPFAVYHFNRIAVYTSLANLAAGPVIGLLIMPFTLLALLLMPLGLDTWCLQVVGLGIGWVNEVTFYVSSLPGAALPVLSMPLWGLLLIVAGGLWLALWETSWRYYGTLLIAAGFLSLLTVSRPDFLVNAEADLFAVKDKQERMVILPSRGNNFVKQVWLGKTASLPLPENRHRQLRDIWQGRQTASDWLELNCDQKSCLYRGRLKIDKKGMLFLDNRRVSLSGSEGLEIRFLPEPEVNTVRGRIGNRPWNL